MIGLTTQTAQPLHPLNAALRFVLELAALIALGYWGLQLAPGTLGYVSMLALPLTAATLWGICTVPGDPSRGKTGPVAVAGWVRLGLEFAFFGSAVCALTLLGHGRLALAYGASVCTHYLLSRDRTRWLLRQRT